MLLGFHHIDYYHYAYALNQYLASQGYIVLSVNYRSGTGYGLKFREALNYGAGGNSEFNDVLGAGLFLQNHPNVDSTKIGLWGGSYGGYLTAMGLARASDMFAAGVDIHGVMNWNVIIKNFIGNNHNLKSLSKILKTKCGVGGSAKNGEIIIQGNVRDKVIDVLKKEGYNYKIVGG